MRQWFKCTSVDGSELRWKIPQIDKEVGGRDS